MLVEYQSRLQILLNRAENKTCVDCSVSNPTWATLIKNRKEEDAVSSSTLLGGAFVCANCIGAHRKLGTHIVFAKSVSLDRWNINEIEAMECNTSGNSCINLLYEAALVDEMEEMGVFDIKPTVNTDARSRERFVFEKYANRRWYRKTRLVDDYKVKSEKSKEEEEMSQQPVFPAVEEHNAIQESFGLVGKMASKTAVYDEYDDDDDDEDDDDKELELSTHDLQIVVKNKREIGGVRGKDNNFVELLESSLRDLMLSDPQCTSTSKNQQRRRSTKTDRNNSGERRKSKKSEGSSSSSSSSQKQRKGHHHPHHHHAMASLFKDVHQVLECARGGNVIPRETVVSIICIMLDCSKKKINQDNYSACMVAISVDISQHHHEGGNGGGGGGEGKTTIAALVCMQSNIRSRYHRGMAWLSMGHHHSSSSNSRRLSNLNHHLDFDTYCRALTKICNQIGIKSHPKWTCTIPMIRSTGDEDDAITQLRLLKCMRNARSCMGELLTALNRKRGDERTRNSILIILDNIIDPTDIEWFQFRRGGVEEDDQINDLLITSRMSEFENDDVQIYLAPPLETGEAVSLLLTEADLPVDHPLANCNAAMHLVRECFLHPLLIKFAGRWMCLRRVTSGGREGYEGSVDEIRDVIRTSSSGNGDTTFNALLFKMMDHALSPRAGGNKTSIFRLCFVALVNVFYNDKCTTVLSKKVVSDYFKEVIEMEKDALVNDHFYRKYGEKSSKLVLEILGALSIVNFTKHSPTKGSTTSDLTVQIDHDLFRQFGQQILDDKSMHNLGKREDVERQWNEAYLKSYTNQNSNYLWGLHSIPDRSRKYALENIPIHMIRAELLDELEILLQHEGFIRARVRTLGWMVTTRAHVNDSKAFAYVNNQTLVVIFNKVEAVLMSEVTGKSGPNEQCFALEAGQCLHELSVSLARYKLWDEAWRLCDLSVQLVQNELGTSELVASLLYNFSVISMKVKKFDEAKKSIANSLKMTMKSSSIDIILYVGALSQLGDILRITGSYKKAEAAYSDALQIVQALDGDQSPLLIQIFIGTADLLVVTSNFDDAVGYYTQCLEMQERILGKEHDDIASTMYSMGLAMLEKGSFVVALDYFSISLDMRVHLHGENHPIIADTYDIMGFVEAKSGDLDASLQLLSNSLELRKVIGDKLREADTRVNIGNLFREKKDFEHALQQYNESLMIRINALSRNCILVADVLMAIGNVHGDMNNISDALDQYREAVEIFASVNGPTDVSVGLTFQNVGMLQVRAGNLESGRLFLEQAVDIYRQLGQEYVSNLVIPLFVVGNIYNMLEKKRRGDLGSTLRFTKL